VNSLLRDVHIEKIITGTNSVIIGDTIQFTSSGVPKAMGEIGMDVTTGKAKGFVGGVVDLTPAGPSQHNVKWSRPSVSTIQAEPDDTDQIAYFGMTDAAGNSYQVPLTAAIVWTVTSTGAIGGTRSAAAAADNGYEIYAVAKAGGAGLALVSELNGTALTFSNLAALDATYTLKSQKVFFGSYNNTPVLVDFYYEAGFCNYKAGVTALAAGVSLAWPAIDCTEFVPHNCMALLDVHATHTLAQDNEFALLTQPDVAGLQGDWQNIGTLTDGRKVSVQGIAWASMRNPATSMYYYWLGAPTGGAWIKVLGWRLT